jgi:hypothetical protein
MPVGPSWVKAAATPPMSLTPTIGYRTSLAGLGNAPSRTGSCDPLQNSFAPSMLHGQWYEAPSKLHISYQNTSGLISPQTITEQLLGSRCTVLVQTP